MDNNTPRAEAERWLGISGKLLTARDFLGSKTFALRARESDPTNHLSDQILAVVDTVLAAEKRLPTATHHPDWYSVLQLPRLVRDPELISGHYRRLVMLLDPDRNRLPFADYALRLVIDGWSVLSDPTKKWIFDNELSVYLQSVENHHQFQQQQQPPPPPQQQMINTFQFLQSPATAVSAAVVVEQTSPSTAALMWQQLQQQQQQHQQQQQQHHSNENNSFININNNVSQIEFMQAPPPPAADMRRTTAPEMRQEVEMLPPQWRVREDAAAAAAEGMRRFADVAPVVSNVVNATVVAPVPVVVTETPKVIETGNNNNNNDNDGGIRVRVSVLGENNLNNNINDNSNNNDNNVEDDGIRVSVVEEDEDVVVNEEKDDENVEEVDGENVDGGGGGEVVESFWTSCPYCFYTYEYQKMYQECTLRCQNCRRGFHAIKVADPPSIDGGEEGGKEGKKVSSFGSWGFFPLGFSKVGWKKSNQVGKSNVASTWMPFSPMFVSPVENGSAGSGGGADFKWFSSSGAAAVGPKNLGRMPASRPRVYIDEDGFDSGSSESDSSDKDWRRNPAHEKKMTKKRRVSVGQMRKVRASYVRLPSIGPRDVVMGLHAVVNNNAGKKKVASTVGRNPVKRKVKNMGRLDLNVEFNNEGDEHAPAVSAVNGEDDAIENIGFFEGLDEFFSTLPILNVSGEKAKPS